MNKFQLMTIVGSTSVTLIIVLSIVLVSYDSDKIIYNPPELADNLNRFLVSSSNANIISISTGDDEFILKIEISASDDGVLVLSDPLTHLQQVYLDYPLIDQYVILVDGYGIDYVIKEDHVKIPFKKSVKLIEVVGGIEI